ncbi:MAG: hypothetical protein IIA48_09805 [Bacteroidetes bacterium]|nr:hypothetical protein [Bacteroidota bacterium]
MKIAILGWGSLLWDKSPEFDKHHEDWQFDGPSLKIEFSRVSGTRNNALTLVLDTKNGKECQVAYALSKRKSPDDAICDVRSREGTTLNNVGFYFTDKSRKHAKKKEVLNIIQNWASEKKIDVIIWTDLESNFQKKSKPKKPFSIEAALCHIQTLDNEGKAKAAEYVWLSPKFVETPLREALQAQPWFQNAANHGLNIDLGTLRAPRQVRPAVSCTRERQNMIRIIAVIFLAAILLSGCDRGSSPSSNVPDTGDVHGAWAYMQLFVEQRLKSTKSAEFPYGGSRHVTDLGEGRYRVVSYVDAQNSFGATTRNHFEGVIKRIDGAWQLESLVIK